MSGEKKPWWVLGVMVLVGLSILTGLEYVIAVNYQTAIVALFVIAIIKAALIMQVFMHMSTLWSEEGGH